MQILNICSRPAKGVDITLKREHCWTIDVRAEPNVSGPAQKTWIFKLIKIAIKKSPFHNKFPIDDTEALREAQELYTMKTISKMEFMQ